MVGYSRDWTSSHLNFWEDVLGDYIIRTSKDNSFRTSEPVSMLEIGCYEGRSTKWFLENVLTEKHDKIWVVDPHLFEPYTSEQRFWKSVISTGAVYKVIKQKQTSFTAVPHYADKMFDIIYIDGDHEGEAVVRDAFNCFQKLKQFGIMIFDDYLMPKEFHDEETNLRWKHKNSVKKAVDTFIDFHKDELEVIGTHSGELGSQLAIKRL